jgi:hypothetical protein
MPYIGEVEWVKEQNKIFAGIVRQAEACKGLVGDGVHIGKCGSLVTRQDDAIRRAK